MLPRPPDTQAAPRAWRTRGAAAGRGASSPPVAVTCHARTVGERVGILAARTAPPEVRRELAQWKADGCPVGEFSERMTADLLQLLRAWCPRLPAGWVVTTPPQGASAPGPYGAGLVAREVAVALDLDGVTLLERTDAKRYHGRHYSLQQAPYRVTLRPPAVALVVDDLITSRTTMRLALTALGDAGVPCFGFAWGVTVG